MPPSKYPQGRFNLFYTGLKDGIEYSLNAPLCQITAETTIPIEDLPEILLYRTAQELESRNIVLGYGEFFRECTRNLVDFVLDEHSKNKQNL